LDRLGRARALEDAVAEACHDDHLASLQAHAQALVTARNLVNHRAGARLTR
jgi:hypothetical protein